MLRSSNNNNNQFEIIQTKNSSLKPNEMNSAAKISNNNKKRVKKDEKNKKKNKKKRSSLAFWFCMGNKTENLDKDRKPLPAQKDKKKGKDEKSSKESKKSNDKKKSSGDTKNNNFEEKKRHRFSAPPTNWIAMMATLEKENEGITSGSHPNSTSNHATDLKSGERSKSPAGVRYRFAGTLEKPYVYPGGLTFHSMRKPKPKDKGRKWSKRSSRKKGSNENVVEAEIHHTDDEDGVYYFDSDDDYDESDVRRQFYLRYDSHMKKKPSKKDRRYSMPAELQKQVEMETDIIGAMYGRGASRWIDEQGRPGHPNLGQKSHSNRHHPDGEEVYDEPYEGSDDEANQGHLMAHSRPSSYYQSPPPLQNSECVYMWHSCEDIPKCEVEYHSEEEVRSSREGLPQDNKENSGIVSLPQNETKDSDFNVDRSNSTLLIRGTDITDQNQIVCATRSNKGSKADTQLNSVNHETTLNENKTAPVSSSNTENTQISHKIAAHIPSSLQQSFKNTSLDLSDDVFSNSIDNNDIRLSHDQYPLDKNLKNHFVKNTTKPLDNPFRRNLGRSSCMPGNKRFFLPPPPTYTPPREEFEIALGSMAKNEDDEPVGRKLTEGDRNSRSRGSQTDLTDEINEEETLDMVEREKRLSQETVTEKQCQSNEKHPAQVAQVAQNGNVEEKSGIEKTQNFDVKDNLSIPSLRDDAEKNSISSEKTNNSSSLDSVEDDVLYINCPKFRKPPSSSAAASSSSSATNSSRGSSRRHTVVTSTPKAKRRSDLSIADSTASTVTKRTPKRPMPTPRQRFSSQLEYSTVTIPSSNSQPSSQSQQQQQLQQQENQQQQQQQKEKPILQTCTSQPTASTPSVRPVAKKRLSQMLSSDSSYTHADIEEGLTVANDEYFSPSNSRSTSKKTSVRKELFSKNGNTILEDDKQSSFLISSSNKTSSVHDALVESGSKHRPCSNSGSSSSGNSGGNVNNRSNVLGNVITTNKSISHEAHLILPPLQKFDLAKSPTASRRHVSSAFSSSTECLVSPLAKSYYYSGLSSSLADIPSQLQRSTTSGGRVLSMFPYDDDDNDDENADDEMSVHNEESPLPRTPSLEDLLRNRSILDRSQAVCRKRRQRLRDRICRSQILSSTEVENYIQNKDTIRRRQSRHSSKKKEPKTSNKPTASTSSTINNTSSARPRDAFSFDHEITSSIPIQSRRFLHRQNRLLNHTDSGMDSDGASPLNSRDFHVVSRENSASPKQHDVSPLDKINVDDISGGRGVLGSLNNKKSWEQRMYNGHRLKKTRSKEFLAHSGNSHHIDESVTVSNGFETLV